MMRNHRFLHSAIVLLLLTLTLVPVLAQEATPEVAELFTIVEFPVPDSTHPHDVAPAPDGTVFVGGSPIGYVILIGDATVDTTMVAAALRGALARLDGAWRV